MTDKSADVVVDTLTLRFTGKDEDGSDLHELRASHVAEVLQGIVGLSGDFDKAGVFNGEGPANSEVLVRPAQQGSFLIEVVRVIQENPELIPAVGAALGVPTLSQVIWWATKSARAGVRDFDHLENGNIKINWQDDTADEVPPEAWEELQKRTPRRKKQLRQIMAPLSDERVTSLDVGNPAQPDADSAEDIEAPEVFVLDRADYNAVKPDDEIDEKSSFIEVEAQMSAIDFDDPTRWRVKTKDSTRSATVEDQTFLARVADGLAIRKSDIFRLRVRVDTVVKNSNSRSKWIVLLVESHRRASGDDE
jgi:hypothetical protein